MTGDEHYREAESLLALADTFANSDTFQGDDRTETCATLALRAQAHATLALVKATKANNISTVYTVEP
jgi:hypothetical protein